MENERLKQIITDINDKGNELTLIPLSDKVDYCLSFDKKVSNNLMEKHSLFLIKNSAKKYVGAVLDMGYLEQHWYVLKQQRKQGYLTKALRETILPHLFKTRKIQYLTAEPESAKRIALALGFQPWIEKHMFYLEAKNLK